MRTDTDAAAFNRELGLKINREIWNERQFDRIPTYFAEDLVFDYAPNVVHQAGVIDNVTGLRQVGAMPAARP